MILITLLQGAGYVYALLMLRTMASNEPRILNSVEGRDHITVGRECGFLGIPGGLMLFAGGWWLAQVRGIGDGWPTLLTNLPMIIGAGTLGLALIALFGHNMQKRGPVLEVSACG